MIRTNPFNNAPPKKQSPFPSKNLSNTPYKENPPSSFPPSHEQVPKNESPYQSLKHYEDGSLQDDEISKQEYESIKKYNCSDDFISCTTSVLPNSQYLFSTISVPIGVSLSPLSPITPSEMIPKVDYKEANFPRCENCKAYMNPFIKFSNNGNTWECNLCKTFNNTDSEYYSPIDDSGQRRDRNERPELCNGTYEIIANKGYWKKDRDPIIATYIFVIDVSINSITSSALNAILESIKDAVNNDGFYNKEETRIGIITYDSSIHFYSFGKNLNQPQMLCVADEIVFLPTFHENLLMSLKEGKDKILSILDLIQNSFTSNTVKDSIKIFQALEAARLMFNNTGGKVILFSCSNALSVIPLMNNSEVKYTKEEKNYSRTDNNKLRNLGITFTNDNISIDIFAFAESFINVLTLNEICDNTNGNMYFYKNFKIQIHYKNLFNQIRRVISKEIAWEGVIKIRLSHGYKITDFITPVPKYNDELLVTSTIDSDQHFQVGLGIPVPKPEEQNVKTNKTFNDKFVYIQTALLYSYGDGSRRIRINNKCIPTSNKAIDIYNSINPAALASWYTKKTINSIYHDKEISNAVIKTETHFSTMISSMFSYQMSLKKELPDNLIYLPLYVLGLIKQRVFCKNELDKKYDIDLSNFLRVKLLRASTEEILSFIYPKIYFLNQLIEDETIGTYDENEGIKLPNVISTHYESMEDDGLYLIDNGFLLIIYVKLQIEQKLLKHLFNVDTLEDINFPILEDQFFESMNPVKERLLNIIDYIRGNKSLFQNMIFVLEKTEGERM